MKAECTLLVVKPVQALAPATLRITDGHQGKVISPMARGRAFQLIEEEARAAPDVIASVFQFYIFVELFIVYAYFVFLLGTYLMNFVHALVLFGSGASKYFVSTSFYRDFNISR